MSTLGGDESGRLGRVTEPRAPTPDQLRRLKDPLERIAASRQAAGQIRANYEAAQHAYSQVIAEAVQELLDGRSLADVAEMLGVSRQRVHRMAKAGER